VYFFIHPSSILLAGSFTETQYSPASYILGINYDPVAIGHTDLGKIDEDLSLISNANFNTIRLKTSNNLEVTEYVLSIAEDFYPELSILVSFAPYQYADTVPLGKDFTEAIRGFDWANKTLLENSKTYAIDFISHLKQYKNIIGWEIFNDITYGEYITYGQYYNGFWNTPSGRAAFQEWMYDLFDGDLNALNSEYNLWFYSWSDLSNNALYPNRGIIGCGDSWRRPFIEFSSVNFGNWVQDITDTIRTIDSNHPLTGCIGNTLYISQPTSNCVKEWGLDYALVKNSLDVGRTQFISTATAGFSDTPVIVIDWGVQTNYDNRSDYANNETEKAQKISAQQLIFASNNNIQGSFYYSLYDSSYVRDPDFGIVEKSGTPKPGYYAIQKMNRFLQNLSNSLNDRSDNTTVGILVTSDVIYSPVPWDQEFITLYDELYRMGVMSSIVTEQDLNQSVYTIQNTYDTLFVISRVYSYGSFSQDLFNHLTSYVEDYSDKTLIMLPILGMYSQNATYQNALVFESLKLCGITKQGQTPSDIWNYYGNSGSTYSYNINDNKSDIYGEIVRGSARWNWLDFQVNAQTVDTLISINQQSVSLTAHTLSSNSEVIALYPDVYVYGLPPSVEEANKNQSAQVFTHILLDHLDIVHDPYLDVISFTLDDYLIAAYSAHSPEFNTMIWGSNKRVANFSTIQGDFSDNTTFIAKSMNATDDIIIEAFTPATYTILLPEHWKKTTPWIHIFNGKNEEVSYTLSGDTLMFSAASPDNYLIKYYYSQPAGVWVTRIILISLLIIAIALLLRSVVWGIRRFSYPKEQKIQQVFEEIKQKYSLGAYALIANDKVISQSENWLPEIEEMRKLYENTPQVNVQGYFYDIIKRDESSGISIAKNDMIGMIVGVNLDNKLVVSWYPMGINEQNAEMGSKLFTNKILK